MKREALLGGLATALLAGCAPEASKVQSQYVSPELYANYDCRQIGAEFGRLSRRAEELGAVVDKQASDDAAQTFVGLVIFWPALFFLEGGETQQSMEYGRLKGEMEALEKASIEKGCGADIQHLAETVETDPSLVPTGTNPQKLEALKVLYRDGAITEEEYLKRRKELTEAQAKEELALIERQKAAAAAKAAEPQPATPTKLRVAILPAGRGPNATTWSGAGTIEDSIVERITQHIHFDNGLELIYSASDPKFPDHSIEFRLSQLWSGVVQKKPRESTAYRVAEELEADLAVLFYWDMGYTNNTMDLYLVDVKQRRVYKRSGKGKNIEYVEKLVKAVFKEQSRRRLSTFRKEPTKAQTKEELA